MADKRPGRRLIVMRHGRSGAYATTDEARPLTSRGRAQAQAVGRYLAERALVPDAALVSPATRTRDTWAAVADSCGSSAEPVWEGGIYSGSAGAVLELLRGLSATARTAMLLGHNPAVASLCQLLDDGEGDPEATTALLRGFPAGAVAVFSVSAAWARVDRESGRLVDFYVPG